PALRSSSFPTRRSSDLSEIGDVQFVTPLIGWLVARQPTPVPFTGRVQLAGSLLASTDGGLTWQPASTRSIWSVCFTDERNGWGADRKSTRLNSSHVAIS